MGKEVKKRPAKSWTYRVDEVGEFMELSMRVIHGGVFTVLAGMLAGMLALGLASHLWAGMGLLLCVILCPLGFLVGFFWLEVKFFLRLLLSLVLGFFD